MNKNTQKALILSAIVGIIIFAYFFQFKISTIDVTDRSVLKTKAVFSEITFRPMPASTQEFSDSEGKLNRIDYFAIDQEVLLSSNFMEDLKKWVNKEVQTQAKNYNLYSIYVYKVSQDFDFKRDNAEKDLVSDRSRAVSYSRAVKGGIDMFYIIENEMVVFDVLKNRAEDPPWEFF